MKQVSSRRNSEPSRLQHDLMLGIVEFVRANGLAPGARITEVALAAQMQVSRTPVRAAMAHLARHGVLRRSPRRGYVVTKRPAALADLTAQAPTAETDRLSLAIARDRLAAALPASISETDLMRRYRVTRWTVQRVLANLAEVGLVERKPGHGWHFLPAIDDPVARAESYRFRQLVEPAALAAPDFRLDPPWAAEMRRRHEAALRAPWREASSIAFFEMNAAFHEGLAAASGNRYLLMAVQQQNRLRRFGNYDWVFGHERVLVNCREHLEILDRLEAGDREIAAMLMRRHLERASQLKRPPRPLFSGETKCNSTQR